MPLVGGWWLWLLTLPLCSSDNGEFLLHSADWMTVGSVDSDMMMGLLHYCFVHHHRFPIYPHPIR
jgi:hypothetical protein